MLMDAEDKEEMNKQEDARREELVAKIIAQNDQAHESLHEEKKK